MTRYNIAWTASAPASNAMAVDLRSPSGARRIRVLEIGWFNTSAVASILTLERLTTLGTQTSPLTPDPADAGDAAAGARIATAWSGSPAASNVPLRRLATPANIGAGCIWTFGPDDLIIPINAGVTLVNRGGSTAAALTGYFLIDE